MPLQTLLPAVFCVLMACPAVAGLHRFELANGLGVVLHSTPTEQVGERIAMRLVVGVGMAHELPSQRGWAHLVEHMAFLGAGRFGRADIDRLFDQAGLRHGRDLNAYTASRHTVYSASVPLDREDIFHDSLDLMHAWLSDLHVDPHALEREKGVVRTEMLSAESRDDRDLTTAWRHLIDPTSARLQRVGADAVSAADADALRRFWATHYRPDNASLVLAGDFDSDRVMAAIEARFRAPRINAAMPSHPAVHTGPAPYAESALSQYNPDIVEPQLTVGFLAHDPRVDHNALNFATDSVFAWWRASAAVKRRCGAVHRERLPLSAGGRGDFFVLSPAQASVSDCLVQLENAVAVHLEAPVETAWPAWREAVSSSLMRAPYAPASSAAQAADALVSRLTADLPTVRPLEERAAGRSLLDTLAPEAARALAATTLASLRTVVAFESADRDLSLPSPTRLRLAGLRLSGLAPAEAEVPLEEVLGEPEPVVARAVSQARARIVSETLAERSADRVITLDSGVRLHHVPAESPRSHTAIMVVNRNNLLQHGAVLESAVRVMPILFDQLGAASPLLSPLAVAREAGVNVSVFVETARQGLILDVPQPALDEAFAAVGHILRTGAVPDTLPDRVLERVHARWQSAAFGNARQLRRVLTQSLYAVEHPPVGRAPTAPDLQNAHSRFFANATETDLFVIGDLPVPLLRHLTRKHLGGLATRGANGAYVHTPAPRNRQIRVKTSGGVADLSVHYLQSRANGLDRRAAALIALQVAFEKSLWHALRDESGLVYQLSVQLLRRPYQRGGASLVVHTQTAPEHAAAVTDAIDRVVASLQTTPIEAAEFARLRERWLHDRHARLTASTGLMFEYALLREHGLEYPAIEDVTRDLKALDAEALRAFAAQFFDETGRVSLVLSPQDAQINTGLAVDGDFQPG